MANSDECLGRMKGKNFHTIKIRRAILEMLKGVVDVLELDDSDNSTSEDIRKARAKCPKDHLVLAKGGDRGKDDITKTLASKASQVDHAFGIGGDHKATPLLGF